MYIYKTTCLINGKIYIGQCCRKDPKYLGSGVLITLAIKKYTKYCFEKEILRICKDQRELDTWEMIYISKFKSTDISIGYNIMPGTVNGFGHINPAKLDSVKKKMSEAGKKRIPTKHSEEHKQNMRRLMLKNNYMKGRFGKKHHLFGKVSKLKGRKGVFRKPESIIRARQRMIEYNNSIKKKTI